MKLESVIEFLSSGSLAAWLVTGAIVAIALAAIAMFVHAYRAGREVSLWPPRIGAHGDLPNSELTNKFINMWTFYQDWLC